LDDTDRMAAAAGIVGHDFARPALLAEALTHPSASGRGHGYERLEFLGDRVLGLVVADMLLAAFSDEDEGALALRFTSLVRRESLTAIADDIGLAAVIEMTRGEEESGGRDNPAILADALEAVIGALYLDGGLATAERFVRRHLAAAMQTAEGPPKDAKTALQEWAQANGLALPRYATVSTEGPAHSPTFEIEARVEGHPPATASGASKRIAQQAAAALLLARIGDDQ
jgi:ribonuclease-3